jgi:site-specific DNA recombinase
VEVANKAAEMFAGRTPDQKRRLLNFVLLNATWTAGALAVEWREPFNLLAQSIAACGTENAADVAVGGVHPKWLPLSDLNRGPSD